MNILDVASINSLILPRIDFGLGVTITVKGYFTSTFTKVHKIFYFILPSE